MKRTKLLAVNLCRMVLALTFIFSGFVKAIDPLGTQYKLQEYFEAVHIARYIPDWAELIMSIGLSGIEFTLGVLLLLAIQRRRVSKVMFAFTLTMLIITFWLMIDNPIQDCGCFGDALKLSNAETFVKNIVLFLSSVVIARWPLYQKRFISKTNQWIATNFTVVFIIVASVLSLYHLPIFDFRPYYIGQNIKKGMEIPKGAKQAKFKTTFICEKNGVTKEFDENNYPYNDTTWVFKDSHQEMIEAGYEPPIHDFAISNPDTGEDLTDSILTKDGYTFLLITPFLDAADDTNFGDIDAVYEYCKENHYPFYGITASTEESIAHWRDITGAEYPFYQADGTMLKTMIRSNPGLMLLYKGTIINKWSHNDLPQAAELNAPLSLLSIGHEPENNTWTKIALIIVCYIFPLVLLIAADRFWAWSVWVKKKEAWMRQKEQWLLKAEVEQVEKMIHTAGKVVESTGRMVESAGKAAANAGKAARKMIDKEKDNKK